MKKYIEIYNHYKELITSNQLKEGDKLPSLRKAEAIFNVSKTTVLNAYFELQADGYIISSEKSGYYVCYNVNHNKRNNDIIINNTNIKYDLKSGNADKECFDIALWQRYIKSALRQEERLLSYGDVQGEQDLREVLCDYISQKRNVSASPDRIVIGAGVHSLLGILCSLIESPKTVSFPDKSFIQGISVFENYGHNISIKNKNADIIYVSPSHMTSFGSVMPIKRRIEMINHTNHTGTLIIEDDFDSDFVYQSKPTPAIYALSGGKNVVYMGSFANVLIPGIRISFMVLTEELAKEFEKKKACFTQTASKTEQIALCGYIRDGHIRSQTRKIRRHYTEKTKEFFKELKKELSSAKISISENGINIRLDTAYNKSLDEFEKNSISIFIRSYENGILKLIIIPSAVEKEDIPKAVKTLKAVLT
ncbi:MAG: PLP-dependent aminotransferase family protein [Eubacterium sp.]|nr:PLP-dependent aminotransferase family protein [Eubacterium sp.]